MWCKVFYLYIYDDVSNDYICQIVRYFQDNAFEYNGKKYKRWKNAFNSVVRSCLHRKPTSLDLFHCLWTDQQLFGIDLKKVINARHLFR